MKSGLLRLLLYVNLLASLAAEWQKVLEFWGYKGGSKAK
jgi:hypothetical protein